MPKNKFKGTFGKILIEKSFSKINEKIKQFRYEVNKDYEKKAKSEKDNNYNQLIYAAEKLFFEPIFKFYSDLKEQVDSDSVPEYIQNFDYY